MDLFQRITPNTTILTPNRRLSASLSKKYTQWQKDQGLACWKTLDILPLYPSWLERLWRDYAAQRIQEKSLILTTHKEQMLWEKILREAPENEYLLQISDTAKLAKSAWEMLKRWRVDLSDPQLKLTDDSLAFLSWANRFKKTCQKNHWLDQNSLANILAEHIEEKLIIPAPHIILFGFTDIPPQHQHLLKVCEEQGSEIDNYKTISRNKTSQSLGLSDTDTEIRTMARWAKTLLNESKTVGCIVPNLESLRENIMQIFSDVFEEKQFNISAGKSLSSYPIIHDALQLLNLNTKSVSRKNFSAILRSPFVGEAERERFNRALFDNRLRNANISTVSLQELVNPDVKHNLISSCPSLVIRINHVLQSYLPGKVAHYPSQWVEIFNKLLSQFGWPGERSLNSHEYQVVQNSWLPLLSEYATFDAILGEQNYKEALHYITCLASNTVFQPESPETPVQILGLLEAADIPFDYSWVMGLDDTAWPSRPKPNPFIPVRLQKTLNMPSASAERELIYCQELTKQLQQSAEHIIFSYPEKKDDAELRPSSLLKTFDNITPEALHLSDFLSPAEKIYRTQDIESLQDEIAPAVDTEEILGGVKIFKNQAECPFKAFSELRLHAKKLEEPTVGLRKLDRGNMVHKALELIWAELQSSAELALKTDEELIDLIHHASQRAINEVLELHKTNTSRYFALEVTRLEKLLWRWLQIEKTRPPFRVIAQEIEMTVTIGIITANFRVDRIDELISEETTAKQLIIDYKTGKYIDKSDWFTDRLGEPQLPIYSIANQVNTVGIAFAMLDPDKMGITGVSRTPLKMDTLTPIGDVKQADATLWDEQMQIWQNNLAKLGDDFFQGKAQVEPKDANQTCRLCGLQSFCRIHELTNIDEEYDQAD